jgi:hypothetical protein
MEFCGLTFFRTVVLVPAPDGHARTAQALHDSKKVTIDRCECGRIRVWQRANIPFARAQADVVKVIPESRAVKSDERIAEVCVSMKGDGLEGQAFQRRTEMIDGCAQKSAIGRSKRGQC